MSTFMSQAKARIGNAIAAGKKGITLEIKSRRINRPLLAALTFDELATRPRPNGEPFRALYVAPTTVLLGNARHHLATVRKRRGLALDDDRLYSQYEMFDGLAPFTYMSLGMAMRAGPQLPAGITVLALDERKKGQFARFAPDVARIAPTFTIFMTSFDLTPGSPWLQFGRFELGVYNKLQRRY